MIVSLAAIPLLLLLRKGRRPRAASRGWRIRSGSSYR
jgi:hypothetical protein